MGRFPGRSVHLGARPSSRLTSGHLAGSRTRWATQQIGPGCVRSVNGDWSHQKFPGIAPQASNPSRMSLTRTHWMRWTMFSPGPQPHCLGHPRQLLLRGATDRRPASHRPRQVQAQARRRSGWWGTRHGDLAHCALRERQLVVSGDCFAGKVRARTADDWRRPFSLTPSSASAIAPKSFCGN